MKKIIQAGCLLLGAGILLFVGGKTEYISANSTAYEEVTEDEEFWVEDLAEEIVASREEILKSAATEEEIIVEEPANVEEIFPEVLTIQEDAVVESQVGEEEAESDSEYANFAISDVNGYVNVRDLPSTDGAVVGKLYHGAVAQIQEVAEDNEWFHIISGSVEGYIKAEYFIYGEAAEEVIEDYVTRYAVSRVNRLNVRKEATTEASKMGYLDNGERAVILENLGDWLKIDYNEGKSGYVSAEYVRIEEEFTYAVSIEEERAEKARQAELAKRQKEEQKRLEALQANNEADEETEQPVEYVEPSITLGASDDIRAQIIELASQYLGNKYVHGGSSLASGTDCSGFTSLLYKEFGYSLSRTPGGQLSSDGRSVSLEEMQIGDIVCYGKKGGRCTHVALYAGDDQIIHSATPKDGVRMGNLYYDNILGIKNVID